MVILRFLFHGKRRVKNAPRFSISLCQDKLNITFSSRINEEAFSQIYHFKFVQSVINVRKYYSYIHPFELFKLIKKKKKNPLCRTTNNLI